VTNGYDYIGSVEDQYSLTLIKPAGTAGPASMGLLETLLPYGLTPEGVPPKPGTEPEKLGTETFSSK